MLILLKKHPYMTLIALTLLLRLGFIITLGEQMASPLRDQIVYSRLATSLVTDGEIMIPSYSQQIKYSLSESIGGHPWVAEADMALGTVPVDTPTSMWDPLYIVIYAGMMGVSIQSLVGMRLLNVLFGVVTAMIGFRSDWMLGGKRTAWITGLALACIPIMFITPEWRCRRH